MKRIFFALLAMVLTSVSAKAVDVIEEGQDYYIMNVESDLFLGAQNSWGTQGAISEDAGIFQFVPGTGEGYNIENTLLSAGNKYLGPNLFTDTNGYMSVKDDEEAGTTASVDGIWRIVDQGGGIFAFYCDSEWAYDAENGWKETPHGYLCKSETKGSRKGYILEFSETLTDACLFYVFTYEEALAYMINKAQSSNVSFNFLIKNPDFCRNQSTAAWTVSSDCTNKNLAGGDVHNCCAESYHSTFTISQIVKDLPAGRYQLSAQGFYRQDGVDTQNMPCVYVGPNATPLAKAMIPLKTGDENSMTTASQAFTAGKYTTDPIRFNLTEKTDLEIGAQCMNKNMWVIWDNIQLMSYSNVAEYGQEILAGIKYPIEGLASSSARKAYEAAYNDFKTFVNNIQQGVQTFDDVDAEYANFVAAENALKASISSWSNYVVVAEKAKTLYEQITSQEGKYNPNTALNALDTYVNAAASAGTPGTVASGYTFANGNYAYIAEYATLNDDNVGSEIDFVNSLMNDVKKQSVREGMDVSFLLTNADFKDTNVGNGWTRTSNGGVNWNLRSGLSGWPVSEAYIPANNSTFDIYQVVENAPAGLYKVTVNAFHRPAGNWNAETKVPVALYMGTIENPIQNIAADPVKNDLMWNDEEQKYINGENAKNGTNCYFWDGNSAKDDADKAAIWAGNQNPDPEIQALIASSTSLTSAGKYNSDSWYNDEYLIPNGMDGASIAFSAGRYPMTVYGEVADEGDGVGTLRIGLKTTEPLNSGAWTLWGGFTLELAGNDPNAMRNLMKDKLNELTKLAPTQGETAIQGLNETLKFDTVEVKVAEYDALYNASPVKEYQEYKDAYDDIVRIIDRVNQYLAAYNAFQSKMTSLSNLIAGFEPGSDATKQNLKTKAQNLYDAFTGLSGMDMVCLTEEDLENNKLYDDETYGTIPEDVYEDNLAEAAQGAGDGDYISTYEFFDYVYNDVAEKMDCIYVNVAGTGTADDPEDLTSQLRNPAFEGDQQWWGDSWVFNATAAEKYECNFDIYQNVWLPNGYYVLAGFAMDRRGGWADVLAKDETWRLEDASWLYAKVGEDDTLQTLAFNAKDIAQPVDITEGAGGIYTYEVNGETWYAPNSMAQYRAWEDAKIAANGHGSGTALRFEVDGGDQGGLYAKLGFFRRAYEGASWFVADAIQLYYAADGYPEVDIHSEQPVIEKGDYTVDCSKTFRGGVVSADKATANAGDVVTFTAVPNANYYLDGMTLELTVEAEDAQARPANQARVAVLTTVELPMTYNAETGTYTGEYTMTNSNVTLVNANFVAKNFQIIAAEDISVYENAVDVAIKAVNQTEGGAALRYAVAEGRDVVEVNAETGALTILKSGVAVIEITAEETEKCRFSSATVNVTVKAIVKKEVALVRGMATFYDPVNAYIIPEDAKVWTGQVEASEEAVLMSEITGTIPAGTPVLITGDAASVTLTPDLDNSDEAIVSDLKPTDNYKNQILDGSENVYALHYGAFVHVTSGTMPTGKAYINFEKANAGARLTIRFDEETGISSLKGKSAESTKPIFDLMGRRLSRKPASGYYIQGGKRYFVK